MYTNLTLYYLNQMGISPWIDKNNLEQTKERIATSLLVITANDLNPKEQSLLRQVLFFIGISAKDMVHIEIGLKSSKQEAISNASKYLPKIALIFGLDQNWFDDQNMSVVKADALSELLAHYALKKKLLHTLALLKQQLA